MQPAEPAQAGPATAGPATAGPATAGAAARSTLANDVGPTSLPSSGVKPSMEISDPGLALAESSSTPTLAAPSETRQIGATADATTPHTALTQVEATIVRVATGDDGSRVSVELNPQSLGHLTISLEKPAEGGSRIVLTASRPETLAMLQQGSTQLGQLLDRAGVASEGRSLVFHLAPAAAVAATAPVPNAGGSHGGAGAGTSDAPLQTGLSGGDAGLAGGGRGQEGGEQRRNVVSASYSLAVPVSETASSGGDAPQAVIPVQGIDITA